MAHINIDVLKEFISYSIACYFKTNTFQNFTIQSERASRGLFHLQNKTFKSIYNQYVNCQIINADTSRTDR